MKALFILIAMYIYAPGTLAGELVEMKASESIESFALVGFDKTTGKVRTWRAGDLFVGVNLNSRDADNAMVRVGGVADRINSNTVVMVNGVYFTNDGQRIGLELSDGKILLYKFGEAKPIMGETDANKGPTMKERVQLLEEENRALMEYICSKDKEAPVC